MPLPLEEIKKMIMTSIPDASVEIKDLMGDKNHYSAKIKSKMFINLKNKLSYCIQIIFKNLQTH